MYGNVAEFMQDWYEKTWDTVKRGHDPGSPNEPFLRGGYFAGPASLAVSGAARGNSVSSPGMAIPWSGNGARLALDPE